MRRLCPPICINMLDHGGNTDTLGSQCVAFRDKYGHPGCACTMDIRYGIARNKASVGRSRYPTPVLAPKDYMCLLHQDAYDHPSDVPLD
jgi:hypothetical protein